MVFLKTILNGSDEIYLPENANAGMSVLRRNAEQ